jgi:hypothetical protein
MYLNRTDRIYFEPKVKSLDEAYITREVPLSYPVVYSIRSFFQNMDADVEHYE